MAEHAAPLTGADALVRTLLACGIDTCFTNPGTSEMHMVAALDRHPSLRPVLALFEGVATGAADGYARLAGKPAASLLHLGPGLANGLANLHNARKARSPVLNVVGEHALPHLAHDAPLTSDIAGFARPVSDWVGRVDRPASIPGVAAEAAAAARAGGVATLLLPADVSWSPFDADGWVAPVLPRPAAAPAEDAAALAAAVDTLRAHGGSALLLLGGTALVGDGAAWAQAVSQATGCRIAAQSLSARMTRGGDLPPLGRVPFEIDAALQSLADVTAVVRLGAPVPVGFFAYPGKPSVLVRPGCTVVDGAPAPADPAGVLRALAAALGVAPVRAAPALRPAVPGGGGLDAQRIGAAIGASVPDGTIVVDESITAGRFIFPSLAGVRHDWLNNMGGAIGYGLPVAIGAAVAAPGRKVFAMIGDGSAFYTEQALWTLARESLDVTVLIFANRAYAVLRNEWARMNAGETGKHARDMLSLDRPAPDWVSIARGHGVDAVRVTEADALAAELARSFAGQGPRLVEAVY